MERRIEKTFLLPGWKPQISDFELTVRLSGEHGKPNPPPLVNPALVVEKGDGLGILSVSAASWKESLGATLHINWADLTLWQSRQVMTFELKYWPNRVTDPDAVVTLP